MDNKKVVLLGLCLSLILAGGVQARDVVEDTPNQTGVFDGDQSFDNLGSASFINNPAITNQTLLKGATNATLSGNYDSSTWSPTLDEAYFLTTWKGSCAGATFNCNTNFSLWENARFLGADFSGATFNGENGDALFKSTVFSNVNLADAEFGPLGHNVFQSAKFIEVDFSNCDFTVLALNRAFGEASFENCTFANTQMKAKRNAFAGTSFEGVDFRPGLSVTNGSQENRTFSNTRVDGNTVLANIDFTLAGCYNGITNAFVITNGVPTIDGENCIFGVNDSLSAEFPSPEAFETAGFEVINKPGGANVEPNVPDQSDAYANDQSGTDFGSASFVEGALLGGTFDNCTWTADIRNAYGNAVWSGSFKNNIFSDGTNILEWGDSASGNMNGADFSGTQFLMEGDGSFKKMYAQNANFDNTVWCRNRNSARCFRQAKLGNSTFSNAYFETGGDLFNGAILTNCVFVDAIFNVDGSVLDHSKPALDFTKADFTRAIFTNGAKVIDGANIFVTNLLSEAIWDGTRVELCDSSFYLADISDLSFGAVGSGRNFELFGSAAAVFDQCSVNSNTFFSGVDFTKAQMTTDLTTDLAGAGALDTNCIFGAGGTAPSLAEFLAAGWTLKSGTPQVLPNVHNQNALFAGDQNDKEFGTASFSGGTLAGSYDNSTWTADVNYAYGEASWRGSFKNNIFSDGINNFAWTDGSGGDMDGADFSGTRFLLGAADSFKMMNASHANFSNSYFEAGARLFNGADLTECIFAGAVFNVSGPVLEDSAGEITFSAADFSGAVFSNQTQLVNAPVKLSQATWSGTRVKIVEGSFSSADLGDISFGAIGSEMDIELFGDTAATLFNGCSVNSNTILKGIDFTKAQMTTDLTTDLAGAGTLITNSQSAFGTGGISPSVADFVAAGWTIRQEGMVLPDVHAQSNLFDKVQSGTAFGGASFSGGTLSGTFDNCTWTTDVWQAYGWAHWSGSFRSNLFYGVRIEFPGGGTQTFTWGRDIGGSMTDGDFTGTKFWLSNDSSFRKMDAQNANFSNTEWGRDRKAENYWRQGRLAGSTFSNAYFEVGDSLFNGSDLTNCVFVDATFNVDGRVLFEAESSERNVRFYGADFSGAVFSNGALVIDAPDALCDATWDRTRVEIVDNCFHRADLSNISFGTLGSGANIELFGNSSSAVFGACSVNSSTVFDGIDFTKVRMATNIATDLAGSGTIYTNTCEFGEGGTAPALSDFVDAGWDLTSKPIANPKIENMKSRNGNLVVQWQGHAGKAYTIYTRDDLADNSWTNAVAGARDISGVDGAMEATDTNAASRAKAFYRLKQTTP